MGADAVRHQRDHLDRRRFQAAHFAFCVSVPRAPLGGAHRRTAAPGDPFPRAQGRLHDEYVLYRFLSRTRTASRRAPEPLRVKGFRKSEPGVYTRVQDGWWNLPNREQDRVAQESQGVIADRTKEHLATSDQGILMLRKLIREAIDAVAQGKDPFGVIRDGNG